MVLGPICLCALRRCTDALRHNAHAKKDVDRCSVIVMVIVSVIVTVKLTRRTRNIKINREGMFLAMVIVMAIRVMVIVKIIIVTPLPAQLFHHVLVTCGSECELCA